jgi:hypothetical protein
MAVAGYSGTPLVNKLGVRPGQRVALLSVPADLALDLPDEVAVVTRLSGHCDLVLFFTMQRRRLDERLDRIGQAIFPDGAAWIAWPKRAAKMATDMTDHAVREAALPRGLVDIKVCAIDETWTGLKVVWRKDRR